jgi:hypothetical protein
MLAQLRQIIEYHSRPTNTLVSSAAVNWVDRLLEWCLAFVQKLSPKTPDNLGRKSTPKLSKSFGYTAAIWQRSSVSVYRSIGENRGLLISPPVKSGNFDSSSLMNSSLGYFNLHGLSDSAEWYGQRDVNDQSDGPDYPVAITPDDLIRNGKAPEIVFSEACYGGYIDGKRESESLALKFLSVGT